MLGSAPAGVPRIPPFGARLLPTGGGSRAGCDNQGAVGKVVELETPRAEQRSTRSRAGRRRRSKTALVLGGGGFTGGVYEIGALRALDLLSVNRTVNEFDVYVGTSAGAFIGSMVANGITPEEMMRVLNRKLRSPIRDIDLGTLLRLNYGGFLRTSMAFPVRVAGMLRELASNIGEVSAVDLVEGLAAGLPNGLYTGRGIERYVDEVLSDPDRSNDFRLLERELYLTATDLDTTERIVLGQGDWNDVPISRAVAASGALPMIYEPVEIKGREFIDGGIRSTTNVDVAVDAGAKFIVVINPLVPFVNDFTKSIPTMTGSRSRRVSDMGFTSIGNQAFRILSHDRLHRAVAEWEKLYPGVDIILIEPELTDELMFGTSILDYRARLEIAKHGFESVTLRLARDYDRYKSIADRHGIELSARRVRHVLDQVEREREEISAWRRVLEQTTAVLLRTQPKEEHPDEAAEPGEARESGEAAESGE
jgi:NTE family protein